ncbi:MAG TPA: endonuclease/exonuclease/phosphatase family protein [Streptosporangiaceae bacterium]|nr:endonuclease/exonuclease/phosphatase family protein [Streptosporangiaceae bacterium]
MRRTSPTSVLFSTYNLFEATDSAGARYDSLVGVIRSLDTDVLAVQEILGPDPGSAAALLRRLAADVGLRCTVPARAGAPDAPVALAMGGHGFHVGLMWRDGIEPVPGTLRCLGARDFWHGLVLVTLDVGGTLVRHASFHAAPFGRSLRADQNERVVAALLRPPGEPPVLIGADWNTECADRLRSADGQWVRYEPADPYADVPWFPDLVHQCAWGYDESGLRRHWADLAPGEVLWAGGLHDAAAALGAPWQASCGHHPEDVYGQHGIRRRVDAIRVSAQLVPALRGHEVLESPAARAASDHLPVTVEYQPG